MKETLTKHSVSVLVYSFSEKNFNNNLQNTLYSIDGNAFTFYNNSVFNSHKSTLKKCIVNQLSPNIHVAVNFLSQVIFVILLFLGMAINVCLMKFKQKKKKNYLR